jgi:shikimate dehydrogenase
MLPTVTGATRILGVIADPVSQARTPGMANALLEQRGLFGQFVLVPMHVQAEAFPSFLQGLRAFGNFTGAIVSMPHKTVAARLVDELTPEATLVGAVNVLRRNGDGRLSGTILDGEGFVAGLTASAHSVAGARVLLVGAGGAASAIAFALAKHGCSLLSIVNRTGSKSLLLAQRVSEAFPTVKVSTTDPPQAEYDIAVNATSLGE